MGWSVRASGDVLRGEGKLQLIICCSSRDGTGELCLGETERKDKVRGQPTWFSGWCGLQLTGGGRALGSAQFVDPHDMWP